MARIFKASDRHFEENPGRIDGYRLMSDISLANKNASGGSDTSKPRNLGSGSLDFDMRLLPSGETSSLYHFHRHAEELFMIIKGSATLRTPDGEHPLTEGDIAFFETGATGAHQLHNHTGEPCIYLDIRTFTGCDIAEYPDSGRLAVIPTMEIFDKTDVKKYFE